MNDIAGHRFERLLALSPIMGGGRSRWLCLCECGNQKEIEKRLLTSGKSRSCGCLHSEMLAARSTTHGASKTRTYRIWNGMIGRCANQNHHAYSRYGGNGVVVCDRWLSFENFLADMGEAPHGLSIDRYPNNGGNYEPGNCRWATLVEQANNKTTNRIVEWHGKAYK